LLAGQIAKRGHSRPECVHHDLQQPTIEYPLPRGQDQRVQVIA
jgi:hypothetical protein